MSGPGASEHLIITADTRRRWSAEEKRAIVEEATQEGRSVSRWRAAMASRLACYSDGDANSLCRQ